MKKWLVTACIPRTDGRVARPDPSVLSGMAEAASEICAEFGVSVVKKRPDVGSVEATCEEPVAVALSRDNRICAVAESR